ncbi:uncharacterized protein BO80DRAFT_373647 [Aspergillus ibericus CBS 121593]|uniref:Pre-mRNA-splicing factor 38B n=1 Tax=Aspergillus ibericus CBS 121593 TaxID=1448316 RepID=A0A395HFX0_9EURO|nr:hypothetical protein BO80DRAFT_373647 [Aspergillus ibericus CBS 121593]RAL05124.1 hypothetical protein BO80DRAFT_373647 [Aspergillus ibericus CBS 121593]
MPPKAVGDPSDDAYVAQVLAREARDSSLKYSAHGLEAYMPKRPTGAAPKPNTRFLRNIIRETDNHNAALKRKEEREARERMRQLKTQASSSSSQDAKREQRRSQRTSDDRESRHDRRRDREGKSSSHRRRHRSRSVSTERDQSHRSRRRREAKDTDDDRYRYSRKSRRNQSYSRSRSRSPADRDADSRSRRRRYRSRYDSLSRSRSRSPVASDRRRNKDRERGSHRSSRGQEPSKRHRTTSLKEQSPLRAPPPENSPSDNESDPLEDLVGPLPAKDDNDDYPAPIRSRGRGAYKPNMSNIDAHFAPDYDPTTDVHLEEDGGQAGSRTTRRPVPGLMNGDDDWELALEALRDRARWKQRGEERLREAGFSNDFVDRWKSNTTSTPGEDSEGRLEDVKWSKKGEGREWDRGKFVDEDGHIDVKASW